MYPAVMAILAVGLLSGQAHPWKTVNRDKGITVQTRPVAGSSIKEVRAEMVIPTDIDRVWAVITDVPHFTEYMPYLQEARIVSQKSATTSFVYQRLDPPLVGQRDYTLRVTLQRDPNKQTYLRSWQAANSRGPKPCAKCTRVTLCNGNWTLQSLGPKKTRAIYTLHTDPGGSVPSWVADMANTRSLPDLLRSVGQRCLDPNWKR